MKKMILSTKLAAGFGAILLIALALGSLAIFNMSKVETTADLIAGENVPEVAVATNVERWSLQTMYTMRGYAYTEEAAFLDGTRKNLAEVKRYLVEAKTQGASSPRLAKLKEAAEKAEVAALQYEQLMNETVTLTGALEKERASAEESAAKYLKACIDWLGLQNQRLAAALKDNAKPEVFEKINRNINLATEIRDLGNTIIIGTWKSQFRRDPVLFAETEKLFDQVNAKLEELRQLQPDAQERALIEGCNDAGKAYRGNMDRFLEKWLAREEVVKRRIITANTVLAQAQATAELGLHDTTQATAGAAVALRTANKVLFVGLGAAMVLGIAIAYFLTRSITRPILHVAQTLSSGAKQTTAAAEQVSSSSQALAEGANEQAASLEETSSSLEEMSSMTKRNADNAQRANDLARQARHAAESGASDMQAMATAMSDIKSSSDEIGKIIKTIDEIAFQTNILALNAAVEAARAGEAGAGFAVVADEVRNLAQRSAVAAKETAAKIEGAIAKTALGVQLSSKVAATLQEIVNRARQVDELAGEVATASKEQTQGIVQLNLAIGQIDKVTQNNAANAEESASAAEELNAQAQSMQEVVGQLLAIATRSGTEQTEPTASVSMASHSNHAELPKPRAAHAKQAVVASASGQHDDQFADFSDGKSR